MDLSRRRQFVNKDGGITILHPTLWHMKFKTKTDNQVIIGLNNNASLTVEEVVSAPDGYEFTYTPSSGSVYGTLVASTPGDYEIYLSISATSNCGIYYACNVVYYNRLPLPYASNSKIRPLYGFQTKTGTQSTQMDNYCLGENPPQGPSNTALGTNFANSQYIYIYVPKGCINNYITNSNSGWSSMYNAGRLIEVDYKIIND